MNFEEAGSTRYSQVTNADRFRVLHAFAIQLLDELERTFDVKRSEGFGLDPEMEKLVQLARPTVTLVPRRREAAPLAVVFSTFPGLYIRFGLWCKEAFPTCGCDACAESPGSEIERLKSHICDLTSARFREALVELDKSVVEVRSEFWSAEGYSGQRSRVELSEDQSGLTKGSSVHDWRPWPSLV